MDSNFTFKLTANPRDSHTFATHRYGSLLDNIYIFYFFGFIGINAFIKQGHIRLIKSDSKDFYIATKNKSISNNSK